MADKKTAIAMGFFDGIHIGHAALLNETVRIAEQQNYEPCILSFDIHPDLLVSGSDVKLICSPQDREYLADTYFGIKHVILMHFGKELMETPWDVFAEQVVKEHNTGALVVGYDFRFGYRGIGTPEKLKDWCSERGILCSVVPQVMIDGITVSSSYIRNLLADGKMEEVSLFLGHPYVFSEIVQSGFHLGTKMGTPTINMHYPDYIQIPRHGVYASRVFIDGKQEEIAVTNVGVRPTVSSSEKVSVESFLLDFSGDLYGKQIRLELCRFIRPEMKFESVEALAAQIQKDADAARSFFTDV